MKYALAAVGFINEDIEYKVKPHNKAGTNEYGQTVKYEDAFYYCPLCN